MSHNITIEGGTSVRLPTAGKYCDQDIIITATGTGEQPPQSTKYKARLDYLESTGTQWIDTGIMSPLTVEATLQGVAAKSRTSIVLSIGGASSGGDYFGFDSQYWMVGPAATFDISYSEKITATIVWAESGITVTIGNATQTRAGGVSGTLRIGSPVSSYSASCKIFDLKIYNAEGVLVGDFIPVLDWGDRPCMYDKVSNRFFYNQGSGEFLHGEPIMEEVTDDLDVALTEQEALIEELKETLKGKASGGDSNNHAKFTATPDSSTSFIIENPLGGIAKKVSIKAISPTITSSRKIHECCLDWDAKLGAVKAYYSSGNVSYVMEGVDTTPNNANFRMTDGFITAYRFNSATTWDTTCEYEIEIYQ